MLGGHIAGRLRVALKGIGSFIELDWHSTVVNLIGNGKGRIIVVRSTHKPGGIGNMDLTAIHFHRITLPCSRNQIQNPLILARHLKYGKHFCKIVLNTGKVHLIQHDQGRLFTVVRFIQRSQELSLIEALGKLIEIS